MAKKTITRKPSIRKPIATTIDVHEKESSDVIYEIEVDDEDEDESLKLKVEAPNPEIGGMSYARKKYIRNKRAAVAAQVKKKYNLNGKHI